MSARVGIYAGSYDPFTYGHLSVVEGALKVFDRVIIAIGVNPKKKGLFPIEERKAMIRNTLQLADNETPGVFSSFGGAVKVEVTHFEGLLIDFAQIKHPSTIVRGLRAVSDFEQEMSIADANRKQCSEVQTIFIPAEARHAFVSSSTVKELALYPGSDLSPYVTDDVAKKLREALGSPKAVKKVLDPGDIPL